MTRGNGLAARAGLLVVAAGLAFSGGCSKSNSASSSSTTTSATNTAAVAVGFGALGPSYGYVNGIWASVTICTPGSTTSCETIPNILVDTGSVGLRVLSSALTVSLPSVQVSGNPVQECVQFASFAYTWGPVELATVQITGTGEKALQVPGQSSNSGIPIQILAASPVAAVPSGCLATAPSPGMAIDTNTLETLGGNGILGIGTFPQDCGSYCAATAAPEYYVCPGGVCAATEVSLAQQLWNPVSAFSSTDNNGVVISLPSVGVTGSTSAAGSMIFGIGTQSNNGIGSAQVYEIDGYGNFPEVVVNGVTYASPNNGSFIDSGSNLIYYSDAASLASKGIVECTGQLEGEYCPSSTVSFTATTYGANNVHGAAPFNIANALTLLNTGFAAFNDIGGDSGTGPSSDYLDLGLPFFFGRMVYVGIYGANANYPTGYWAF